MAKKLKDPSEEKTTPPLRGTPPQEGNAQAKNSPPAEGRWLAAGKGQAKPDGVVPKLRFPEFRSEKTWRSVTLDEMSDRITEKVGGEKLLPVSITAGTGFVSQIEKFGRDISGEQYKNYIRLREGEFSYNKGNSKKYAQGCIYKLREFKEVAAPYAYISFRLHEGFQPDFYQYLFEMNAHGKQLQKFITSGARADGLLNIDPADFFHIELPSTSLPEQQKIADCLTSLDTVITAEAQILDALKAHKKGVMQQLFPAEGETVPHRRFPEFRDSGEWEEDKISSRIALISGLHLSPDQYGEAGDIPYFTGPSDFTNDESAIRKWTSESINSAQSNDILITVKGSGVGSLWHLTLPSVAMGRQLMAIRPTDCVGLFIFQNLIMRARRFQDLAAGNLIPGLSRDDILQMTFYFPAREEQQRIANCLTSLDELIAAQAEKIEALKAQKKGLLQGLFPLSGL
ncbi:MAG: restriction endonuclease subunit S [Turneriella sp.]